MTDLLTACADRLHATLRHDRRYHSDCPFCGKEEKRGQKHFSFVEAGYVCWVCSAQGGLWKLAEQISVQGEIRPMASRQVQEPPKPRHWQSAPDRWLQGYCEHPNRLPDWQAYKPLSIDTIARYRLGVGVLPSSRCQERRLILPVFASGQIVAFHGRAYRPGDEEAKWLTAGGSRKDVLFNGDALRPDVVVIICENMVDCLLAQEAETGVVAVAGGGVGWRPEWTQQIAASRPTHVLVWLDNDLVGCPNESTRRELLAGWHVEMQARVDAGTIPRIPTAPAPHGPQIANALLNAGVQASVYRWPEGTPPKADLGAALMQERNEK